MKALKQQAIFDGHNDVLLKLWQTKTAHPERDFFAANSNMDISFYKAAKGGLFGGLCAIFPPNAPPNSPPGPDSASGIHGATAKLEHKSALHSTLGMAALLNKIEHYAPERFKICRTVDDILSAQQQGQFAAILHIEGLEAVDQQFDELHVLQLAGLRSVGPVWGRPNIFGFGVPARFASTPDIGPGLTALGRELVKLCNQLHIMIDLSHLNEQGFWDIAKLSHAPLVASHSNAHALCPHSRNLTDRQLDAIGASGGLVGINYGVIFLREDGMRNADTPLDTIVQHICYIVKRIGIDHVALGSDFDGTTMPTKLRDAAALPQLISALQTAGFSQDAIDKISYKNWLRILQQTWKERPSNIALL